MKTFKHKTILITGASRGIGEAMARQLADPTVTLLLTARSGDRLRALASDLEQHGATTDVFLQDMSRPDGAQALYEALTDAGHTVDVLINNAGFGKFGRFESETAATYEEMLTLNLTNLVALTRLCLPDLLARRDAGLLNVASTAAYQPLPYFAVYAASKSFVLSLSQALHSEYRGRGLTVTCLSPGPTRTAFQKRAGSASVFPDKESPEKVARTGLRALLEGTMEAISGSLNTLGALAGRLSPPRAVVALMSRLFKPRA